MKRNTERKWTKNPLWRKWFRCISSLVAYSKMATICVTVRYDVNMDEITSTQLIIIIDVECCHWQNMRKWISCEYKIWNHSLAFEWVRHQSPTTASSIAEYILSFNGTNFTQKEFRKFVQYFDSIASFKVGIELILRGLKWLAKRKSSELFFCNNNDTTIIVISVDFERDDRLRICVQCQWMRIIYEYGFSFWYSLSDILPWLLVIN